MTKLDKWMTDHGDQPQLKPCPFCGGRAVVTDAEPVCMVYCLKCGGAVTNDSKIDAIRRWNNRYVEPGSCDSGFCEIRL